jgi:hypothetical protein
MTQKSSHLAKAIKQIYKYIDNLDKSNKSQLDKEILEVIIDHLNLLIQANGGAK